MDVYVLILYKVEGTLTERQEQVQLYCSVSCIQYEERQSCQAAPFTGRQVSAANGALPVLLREILQFDNKGGLTDNFRFSRYFSANVEIFSGTHFCWRPSKPPAIMRLEGFDKTEKSQWPQLGIEPMAFRLAAQFFNQPRYRVSFIRYKKAEKCCYLVVPIRQS
jgi:hypothetical protein